MPAYQVTWHVEVSGDEAALEMIRLLRKVHAVAGSVLPPTGRTVSLTLTRVLDDGES